MNGSKPVLLAAILAMALLPWGLLLYIANSEPPETDASVDADRIRQETALRFEGVIERLEKQIALLEKENTRLEAELERAPASDRELADLRLKLEEEREEKLDALQEVARLQDSYNSALSEVVRMQTERLTQPPPARTAEPEPEAAREPAPQDRPPDTGGWILPPAR